MMKRDMYRHFQFPGIVVLFLLLALPISSPLAIAEDVPLSFLQGVKEAPSSPASLERTLIELLYSIEAENYSQTVRILDGLREDFRKDKECRIELINAVSKASRVRERTVARKSLDLLGQIRTETQKDAVKAIWSATPSKESAIKQMDLLVPHLFKVVEFFHQKEILTFLKRVRKQSRVPEAAIRTDVLFFSTFREVLSALTKTLQADDLKRACYNLKLLSELYSTFNYAIRKKLLLEIKGRLEGEKRLFLLEAGKAIEKTAEVSLKDLSKAYSEKNDLRAGEEMNLLLLCLEVAPKKQKEIIRCFSRGIFLRRKDRELTHKALDSLVALGTRTTEVLFNGRKKAHVMKGRLWLELEIIHAIGRISDPSAVTRLLKLTKDHDNDISVAAITALGFYGKASQKNRKKIFEYLMKGFTATANNSYSINNSYAQSRLHAIREPMNRTLQEVTGLELTGPDVWRDWWNDNKHKKWKNPKK